ncbi:MAG: glycosyltransferase family 2 protein [Chitinophagales bacterium]
MLMPVKNAEPFLWQCLDSIIHQSYGNWELLAVNDHSDDDSFEILENYSAKDKRIQVLQNTGKGIIPALRLAYEKSKGKYITRMDADDICKQNKLGVLLNNLLKYGRGHIAIGQVEYFSENELGEGYKKYAEWLNSLTAKGNNFEEIFKECVIPSPCWMLHRADLEKCGAFSSDQYPEDYDLCFRMYAAGLKCIPCNQTLHLWRDHPERSSRNDPNYLDNHFSELKIKYFLKSENKSDRALVLWGAGKRGKKLAVLLNAAHIDFHWICNNPNKIGNEIYGQVIHDESTFPKFQSSQVIVAVANSIAQENIRAKLQYSGMKNMKDYFFFC